MKTTKRTYGIALTLTVSLAALSQVALPLKAQELYVATWDTGLIGEYGLDGSTVNASLISGPYGPDDMAISGNDIFAGNVQTQTIGEYTTSGATVNADLISGLDGPVAVAISGNDLLS